jgi:cyclopropane fatty-acyl-phospholipid synthase-like methyltransferase
MTRRPAPNRITWAVELLDVRPDDRVLEIGCGRGVAATLICQRLQSGRLVGLDRSATAITAARALAAACVEAGSASFHTGALAAVAPAALGRFDKVLAVNVNLFWTKPAPVELQLVAELLEPGGRLQLVYEPPSADRIPRIRDRVLAGLSAAGYRTRWVTRSTDRAELLAISGHR